MLMKYKEFSPEVHKSTFIAHNATVIGRVKLGANVGIWFNTVIRGDIADIEIGEGTNIQDGSVVHCDTDVPTVIGKNVTVGHGAILHSCTIGDDSLVGMGAIILSNAKIGKNCLIGAGALVTGSADIPDRSVVMGSPAKVIRSATEEEIELIKNNTKRYIDRATEFILECETI